MKTMIIDIGLLRYIVSSKCKIITKYLITQIHEQRYYRYWTITIYFELKIQNNINIFNHEVP